MENEEIVEVIKRAIQTEWDGNRFYNRAAEATQDPRGKKMFEQLANDEIGHVEMIENLYHDLLPEAPQGRVKGYPMFAEKKKKTGGVIPDFNNEFEVLKEAIENEITARDFYRDCVKKFDSENAKDVFRDLTEMEDGHVRLLTAELDFLEQSGFWFDHMEFNVEGDRE
jgi:rubrerythrin